MYKVLKFQVTAMKMNPARNGGVYYCHNKPWMVKKLLEPSIVARNVDYILSINVRLP